jgi:hypothetical protein
MLIGFGFIDFETIPNVLFRKTKDKYTFGIGCRNNSLFHEDFPSPIK